MIVVPHGALRDAIHESLLVMQPGWEYVEARNSEEAFALAMLQPIHVALVDNGLAEPNSMETARRIKAIAPRARVVMLTDYDDPNLEATAKASGVEGFVRKRGLLTELAPLLSKLLSTPGTP